MGRTNDIVARLRLGDMQAIEDSVDLVPFKLCVDTMLQEGVASSCFEHSNAFVSIARDLNVAHAFGTKNLIHHSTPLGLEVIKAGNVSLVEDYNCWLIREQRFDGVKQLTLRFDGVTALLRDIHEV